MTVITSPRKFVATVGAPHLEESLRGYLGRALAVTAVRRLATMLKLAEVTTVHAVTLATTLTDAGEIERIATLIGCVPQDIASRTYRKCQFEHSGSESIDFFGTQIRSHFRESKYRRVSPRALEIAQYHRASWELRPLSCDSQTKEKLIVTCPACKRRLGWMRADVPFLCDKCDVDLRAFRQPVLPVEDEEAFDFVAGLVEPDPTRKEASRRLLPEVWRDFSNGDLFETIIALASGLTVAPTQGAGDQGGSSNGEQFEALTPEMLALAGRAMIGGEPGFAALAERYRADMEKRPSNYGRRKELGPLAYIAYEKHIEPKIRSLLGNLVDANMKTTCRDYSVRKGPDADASMLTIQQLAGELGVRRQMLQRLANSGLVPVIRARQGRSPIRMAVRDVMPLLLQLKDAVSEMAAAGLLGLPRTVLPSFVDRGLIRRLQGPICGLLPGYSGYSKTSVHDLMDKVWSAARPAPEKCCSLAVAARSVGKGETPWAAVISAIISETIVVFDKGTKRRNIRCGLAVANVDAFVDGVYAHLKDLLSDSKPPEWIAQSTAAEILQVNLAFLSRLVQARPDLLPQRGPGYTPYSALEVELLAGVYIFVPEIARRIDMHPRRAVSWLRSNKLHPEIALQENRDFGYLRLGAEPLIAQVIDETSAIKASLVSAGDTVRTKLLAAVAAGASIRSTAETMGVPYETARWWIGVWRETGGVAHRKPGRRSQLNEHETFLRLLVSAQPNIKFAEIRSALGERGVTIGPTAVWSALTRFEIALADGRSSCSRRPDADLPTLKER